MIKIENLLYFSVFLSTKRKQNKFNIEENPMHAKHTLTFDYLTVKCLKIDGLVWSLCKISSLCAKLANYFI